MKPSHGHDIQREGLTFTREATAGVYCTVQRKEPSQRRCLSQDGNGQIYVYIFIYLYIYIYIYSIYMYTVLEQLALKGAIPHLTNPRIGKIQLNYCTVCEFKKF